MRAVHEALRSSPGSSASEATLGTVASSIVSNIHKTVRLSHLLFVYLSFVVYLEYFSLSDIKAMDLTRNWFVRDAKFHKFNIVI